MEITQRGGASNGSVLSQFLRSGIGNTKIFVAVDYLTKLVEARDISDATV